MSLTSLKTLGLKIAKLKVAESDTWAPSLTALCILDLLRASVSVTSKTVVPHETTAGWIPDSKPASLLCGVKGEGVLHRKQYLSGDGQWGEAPQILRLDPQTCLTLSKGGSVWFKGGGRKTNPEECVQPEANVDRHTSFLLWPATGLEAGQAQWGGGGEGAESPGQTLCICLSLAEPSCHVPLASHLSLSWKYFWTRLFWKWKQTWQDRENYSWLWCLHQHDKIWFLRTSWAFRPYLQVLRVASTPFPGCRGLWGEKWKKTVESRLKLRKALSDLVYLF